MYYYGIQVGEHFSTVSLVEVGMQLVLLEEASQQDTPAFSVFSFHWSQVPRQKQQLQGKVQRLS